MTELKRNNTKILPNLVSEYSFPINIPKRKDTVFSVSTFENLVSSIYKPLETKLTISAMLLLY